MTGLVVAASTFSGGGGGGGGGSGGGSPPAGVTVDPGFNVSGSTFAHGSVLTIQLQSGSFPPKQFGTGAPWLYDTVDHQYLNGVDLNLYGSATDGTDIGNSLYAVQSKNSGAGTDVMRYWTSRTRRTSYQSSVYGTENMQLGKSFVGSPAWPSAWGTRTNLVCFVSVWAMSVAPFQGTNGGDASTKVLRFGSSPTLGSGNTFQPGANFFASGDSGYCSARTPGGQADFHTIRTGNAGLWMRHDFLLDNTSSPDGGVTPASIYSALGQLLNCWSGVMGSGTPFHQPTYSGFGGQYEISHPPDVMYAPNLPTDSWWDPAANGTPYANIDPTLIGYDDGHGLSVGNSYYINELYVDADLWRFELGDALAWDSTASSTVDREICGKWTRDSNKQCTVTLNFGQQAPGTTGLALYVVNTADRRSAIRVCHN